MHRPLPPPSAPSAIVALMLREMASVYGRSPGGYVWAIAEPVAAIALMAYVFGIAFSVPALGRDFALFYATGYLPFMLFTDVTSKVGTALRFSRALLAFPAITLFDALIARWLLNVMTHIVVFFVVMAGVEARGETGAVYDGARVLNALAMAACLAWGVGLLNAWLIPRFAIWERFWAVMTRPLFVVSGVFFLYEQIPNDLRGAAWFNPLVHVTAEMRRAAYPGYDAAFVSAPYVYGFALVCGAAGLLMLRAAGRDILQG
ncbi:MAG: ABC transporter permease [Pseudomonadota bacterium]